MDDKCIVWFGRLDEGIEFVGPFLDEAVASRYQETKIHPDVPSGWAYLESPDGDFCGNCGSDEVCDCQVSLVEDDIPAPPVKVVKRVPAKIVGTQTSIPDTVPEETIPKTA
jgi:hypothetical protein